MTYYSNLEGKKLSRKDFGIPKNVNCEIKLNIESDSEDDHHPENITFDVRIPMTERFKRILSVKNHKTNEEIDFGYTTRIYDLMDKKKTEPYAVYVRSDDLKYIYNAAEGDTNALSSVILLGELDPLRFSTIENAKDFLEGNPDYSGTGVEAIMGCTKSAVYDGRIFLSGNPELPNTVFFTQRNITGANDPTYFGAYNYMNDGNGNSPNVDLLSTPSMLMVLKNNTVQDGSVYYHVATDNTSEDQTTRDLMPRIYPSTSGAAGLGCAGKTVPGTVACNFLDDPVFLSTRGLEAMLSSFASHGVKSEASLDHTSRRSIFFIVPSFMCH